MVALGVGRLGVGLPGESVMSSQSHVDVWAAWLSSLQLP